MARALGRFALKREFGMTDPIDWSKCICHKIWVGGTKDEHLEHDVSNEAVVTKANPKCPEWGKPGHPRSGLSPRLSCSMPNPPASSRSITAWPQFRILPAAGL